ncbi:hypothetical protein Leryth_011671 [Lithospermum erythrorhizon]|nr:hypothetical protein Leryth_011671 [Lithospermum erythrorhizon]
MDKLITLFILILVATAIIAQASACYEQFQYCVYDDECCTGACDLNYGQGGGFYGMCINT